MSAEVRIDTAALDALFAPYDRTDAPGFAVGVALNGRPGYRRGFGMASIELPVVLSPTIRMRIGSTSKHFTVLAMMLLAEEGRLSLDDTPRRFLPELPDWADAISLRQLAAHTSGMRDSLDLILHSAGVGRPAPADFQFRLMAGLDSVNFAAGSDWNYNNGGYVLLAEIVARVAEQPFATFLKERLFDPIGMHDTMLRPLDTDLVPNSATLHVPTPAGGWRRGVFGAPIGGEGGIVSTVDDMLRWVAHMRDPVIGSHASWAEMRTPLTTHGYGLGLFMARHRGLDTVHHAGGVVGGSSQMLKVIDPDLDIILMTNGRSALDIHNLVEAIIGRCIPGLPPAPASAIGDPISGTYHSAATGRTLSLVALDGAQALRIGATTLPAHRDADGALSVALLPTDMRVSPTVGDEAMTVTEFGATDRLVRVEPPEGADAGPITGRYESGAARMTATIEVEAGGTAMLRMVGPLGSLGYALKPIGPDLWEAAATETLPLVATLEFDNEGFRFTSGRTARLRFERAA